MKYLLIIFLFGCTTTGAYAPTYTNDSIMENVRKFNDDYDHKFVCLSPKFVNITNEPWSEDDYELYLGTARFACISRFGMGHPCVNQINKVEPTPYDYLDLDLKYSCMVSIIPAERL